MGCIFFTLFSLISTIVIAQVNCKESTSQAILDINEVRTTVLGSGDLWWNLNNAQYEVPKGSSNIALFAGALWIGGIDDGGQLRIAAQTYRYKGNDYFPGPGQYGNQCEIFDRHWSVKKTEIQAHQSNFTTYGPNIPLSLIPTDIRFWPAKGNTITQITSTGKQTIYITDDMAPFIDLNGNNKYEPEKGDHPDVPGDQAIWWVFNDYANPHGNTEAMPLNIDVHMLAYAYQGAGILDHTTFYKYKIINRGNEKINEVHIGQWTDSEIGWAFDDYVGCDTIRNMGIGYNSEPISTVAALLIGSNSPMVGVKFLKTPLNDQGIMPGMTRFMYYNNDFSIIGNPELPKHYYNYLTGKWKNDTIWKFPDVFPPKSINYMVPGKPGISWWNECDENIPPGDRRFLMSSGPYTFYPGAIFELEFAVLWKACPDQIDCFADFDCIGLAADSVQAFFDNTVVLNVNHIEKGTSKVTIYPNPSKDDLNIDCNSCENARKITINITDISGRTVATNEFDGNIKFNFPRNNLPPGIYLLSLKKDDNEIINEKVIFR